MATWTPLAGRSVTSAQTTTDSAPSLATDGLNIGSVGSFTLTIEADPGQTLNGGGVMAAYVYSPLYAAGAGGWARAPDLDISIPPAVTGNRRYGGISFQVQSPRGSVAHISNNVLVSGGNLTLYYIASDLYGNLV